MDLASPYGSVGSILVIHTKGSQTVGFDLAKRLSRLDWKFANGVHGVVPEPSTEAVNEFQFQMNQGLKAVGITIKDPEDTKELLKVMQTLTVEQLNQMSDYTIDALAVLCQDEPSRDQLVAVGHRGVQAFTGWIMGELTNPEGVKPASER